jgi:exopolysaccharide biosynthesis protein
LRKLGYTIAAFVYLWVSTSLLLFHGPYHALRTYFINSLATTRHGYLLRPLSLYTLSQADIKKHSAVLVNTNVPITKADLHANDYSQVKNNAIQIQTYKGSTFSADIMLIHDPNLVRVAVTNDVGSEGQTVSEIVKENHAIAGINAGAFEDVAWRGTGGIPLGITMHNGKLVGNDKNLWNSQPVIGLTKNGALVAGAYNVDQLKQLHVREAVSFGPVLVKNGVGLMRGNGGWGYAPRTVIGQRSDGTIIFMVTDGRFIHGVNDLGATLTDVQNLMLRYGATIAVNLDGGSSSTMYYNGKLVNQPTDVLGERKVATAFIVLPK